MALYEIPLSAGNQKFTVKLNKLLYKLRLTYRLDTWYLDILDTAEKPLITGLPLNSGINLIEQYQHILQGGLFATNANIEEVENFNDLGTKIKLYWRDPQ